MAREEMWKKIPGKELTFDFFESNFKDVLRQNPILGTRIDTFMKNVSLKFQSPQVNLIRRAVFVGAVAHQNNEIERKRYREEGDSDRNLIPYFTHPLEMAECMVTSSKKNPTFDWITIVATLLHDVPEDVKLNGIEGKEAWLSTIEEIFKKKAHAPTVHNELILNKDYVLVGRGIYALVEWGYKKGVVAEVIEDILKSKNHPLTHDEIKEAVLKQRMVKENTIYLALMNKKRFKRLADGRYFLADNNGV